MEIAELETFVVLSEELHFARAASRLYLSPARVSQVIGRLERDLGGSLFTRTSRRVRLTPLGEQFRSSAEDILVSIARSVSRARETARGVHSVMRVGYPPVGMLARLLEVSGAYGDAHPGAVLELVAQHQGPNFSDLAEGRLDAVLAWVPPGPDVFGDWGLCSGRILATRERHLTVGPAHPWALRPSISPEELATVDLLRTDGACPASYARSLTPPSSSGRDRGVVSSVHDALTEAARGLAAYLQPWLDDPSAELPGLITLPVTGLGPCALRLVRRRGATSTAYAVLEKLALGILGRPAAVVSFQVAQA